MRKTRVVIIDGHIIAQWLCGSTGWWTAAKAQNNDEGDFAFWMDTPANRTKAMKLLVPITDGEPAMVISNLKPFQDSRGGWHLDNRDQKSYPYNEALRRLARSLNATGGR